MKRFICIALSVLFLGTLFAQQKYPVPELTLEKKNSIVSMNMYGMYVGNIFVHSWNPGIGFDEGVECFTGMLKPFGTAFNCAVTIDVSDTYLVFNLSANK